MDRLVSREDQALYVIVTTGTTPNAGLQELWTNGGNALGDDIKLYGFYHTVKDSGRTYYPPIRMIKGRPDIGEEWDDTVDVFDLPWGAFIGRVKFQHVVEYTGSVAVPAVTYRSISIRTTEAPDGMVIGGCCYPTGRVGQTAGVRAGKTWWARETGEIMSEVGGVVYELVDVNVTNPVEAASWGRIKALYR